MELRVGPSFTERRIAWNCRLGNLVNNGLSPDIYLYINIFIKRGSVARTGRQDFGRETRLRPRPPSYSPYSRALLDATWKQRQSGNAVSDTENHSRDCFVADLNSRLGADWHCDRRKLLRNADKAVAQLGRGAQLEALRTGNVACEHNKAVAQLGRGPQLDALRTGNVTCEHNNNSGGHKTTTERTIHSNKARRTAAPDAAERIVSNSSCS